LLGCILGGAIGNLVDRARLGWVVDFIDIGVGSVRWPVFNVADSAVTLGVLILAWNLARAGRPAPDPENSYGSSIAGR
jgi:signal peptidase II